MERSTLPNPGGIADLGADDRLVVDFLNHSSHSGSQHWTLEFFGSRPGSVLISTAGPRVVRERRTVEVSAEKLSLLDEMFSATLEWGPGETSYCDIKLRRYSGEDLVAEETRRCVTPLPAEGCSLVMSLCQALPPTYDVPSLGSQVSGALSATVYTLLLSPLLLVLLLGRVLSLPLGLFRLRRAA